MTTPRRELASAAPSLGERIFSGTLWMFAMRWAVRLLSIVSVVALARLLEREDFGLAAIASAVIALPVTLLELGLAHAVIRQHRPEPGMYNTAWTIRATQMAIIAAAVFLLGPWVGAYYGDERLVPIFQVLALSMFLLGLENFWTVSFLKQMNFHRDFAYQVACKVLAVVVTIGLAVHLRSYWALIYGQVAASGIRLLLSLVMAPRLPRPTFSHWRLIWSFSQWSLLRGLATYISGNADRLILARYTSTETVGGYTMGREIADLPTSEISGPANRSLGPGLAELQHEPGRFAAALGKAVGAVSTVSIAVGLGLSVTAHDLVVVMLGAHWLPTVPILQILVLGGILTTQRAVLGNALVILGHIRSDMTLTWIRALGFLAMSVPMLLQFGPPGLAAALVLSQCVTYVAMMLFYRRHLPQFTPAALARCSLRPLISGLVMVMVVRLVAALGLQPLPVQLAAEVAAGALTYVSVLAALWLIAGRPDGVEKVVLARLQKLARRHA